MRFKTSLRLGLKEIKIIEISHKKARLHSIGLLAGRCKKISCIFVVDNNNYKLINSGRDVWPRSGQTNVMSDIKLNKSGELFKWEHWTPTTTTTISFSAVLVDSTKKPHKLGSMKNRLISTQKDANASIVVIVMTTKHSDGGDLRRDKYWEIYQAEEILVKFRVGQDWPVRHINDTIAHQVSFCWKFHQNLVCL